MVQALSSAPDTMWTPISVWDMRQVVILHLLPARQPGISNVPHSTNSFILAHSSRLFLLTILIFAFARRFPRLKLSLFRLNILTFLVVLHVLHSRQLINAFLLLIWTYSLLRPFVPDPRQNARWWYLLWPAYACPLKVDPFLMKLASNTNFRPFLLIMAFSSMLGLKM